MDGGGGHIGAVQRAIEELKTHKNTETAIARLAKFVFQHSVGLAEEPPLKKKQPEVIVIEDNDEEEAEKQQVVVEEETPVVRDDTELLRRLEIRLHQFPHLTETELLDLKVVPQYIFDKAKKERQYFMIQPTLQWALLKNIRRWVAEQVFTNVPSAVIIQNYMDDIKDVVPHLSSAGMKHYYGVANVKVKEQQETLLGFAKEEAERIRPQIKEYLSWREMYYVDREEWVFNQREQAKDRFVRELKEYNKEFIMPKRVNKREQILELMQTYKDFHSDANVDVKFPPVIFDPVEDENLNVMYVNPDYAKEQPDYLGLAPFKKIIVPELSDAKPYTQGLLALPNNFLVVTEFKSEYHGESQYADCWATARYRVNGGGCWRCMVTTCERTDEVIAVYCFREAVTEEATALLQDYARHLKMQIPIMIDLYMSDVDVYDPIFSGNDAYDNEGTVLYETAWAEFHKKGGKKEEMLREISRMETAFNAKIQELNQMTTVAEMTRAFPTGVKKLTWNGAKDLKENLERVLKAAHRREMGKLKIPEIWYHPEQPETTTLSDVYRDQVYAIIMMPNATQEQFANSLAIYKLLLLFGLHPPSRTLLRLADFVTERHDLHKFKPRQLVADALADEFLEHRYPFPTDRRVYYDPDGRWRIEIDQLWNRVEQYGGSEEKAAKLKNILDYLTKRNKK
jgi:hypothetical protein